METGRLGEGPTTGRRQSVMAIRFSAAACCSGVPSTPPRSIGLVGSQGRRHRRSLMAGVLVARRLLAGAMVVLVACGVAAVLVAAAWLWPPPAGDRERQRRHRREAHQRRLPTAQASRQSGKEDDQRTDDRDHGQCRRQRVGELGTLLRPGRSRSRSRSSWPGPSRRVQQGCRPHQPAPPIARVSRAPRHPSRSGTRP